MTETADRAVRRLGKLAVTLRALALVSLLLAGRSARAVPPDPLGGEFRVNTYTPQSQGWGAVAVSAASGGDFVVVWDSYSQDGSQYGVFGHRFNASGTPVGAEFQVNSYTTGDQGFGALAVSSDATGNFVVVWGGQGQGDYQGVFAQRYNSAGGPVGGEFMVNTYTTGDQGRYFSGVSVASDPTGNFVVVWGGDGQGGGGVIGRRYDSSGTPLGGEIYIGVQGSFDTAPVVATDAAGNFAVVWGDGTNADGSGDGVFGRRYNAAGNPVGAQFQVNSYTTGNQGRRSIALASDPSGNFLVAWNSDDGDDDGVFARRFDSAGNPQGGDFQVNTYTTGNQGYGTIRDASYGGIAIAGDPSGNYLVVWDSDYIAKQDGNGFAVMARRYDGAGNPLESEFVVNTYTTGNQYNVAAAALSAGRFVVAWTDDRQDGQYNGVFAQRFGSATPAPKLILGKTITIKNSKSNLEMKRSVSVTGREAPSDIAAIVGDPTVNGATLRIIANGTTDSDETFVLDSVGWTPTRDGFKYIGPTGADGDPVKKASIGRSRSGEVILKATIRGSVGTQNVDVVPPNTASDGGAILTINGGDTYCVAFGGSAGGIESKDDATTWKVKDATAQPGCPSP